MHFAAGGDGAGFAPLPASRRIILAGCEKGAAESVEELRSLQAYLEAACNASPNLVELAAREVWRPRHPELVADPPLSRAWTSAAHRRKSLAVRRGELHIGIPRVLSFYAFAPLFSAYLESLGVLAGHIVYSDVTSAEMVRAGSSRGSIDPCFPSKIALAHFHNLIYKQHPLHKLDAIFFPMFDVLATPLVNTRASNGCPTACITPETVEAAFTKETDLIAERGIRYIHPLVNLSHRKLFARQMLQAWDPLLGLTEEENWRAVEVAFREQGRYESSLRRQARELLDRVEKDDRLSIVLLGRSYHHDPGINHEIMTQFQKLGYPILSQSTLPLDDDLLERIFGEEIRAGVINHPLESPMSGRPPFPPVPISNSGPPSSPPAIPTWWRSSFPASSAATTPPSITPSSRSSRVPALPTSPLRIWTRTAPPTPSACASRPSTTSSAASSKLA